MVGFVALEQANRGKGEKEEREGFERKQYKAQAAPTNIIKKSKLAQ